MANLSNYSLFVYGSLLSGFKSPAYDYISSYFDLVSKGKVKGILYDMGDYPAAVPGGTSDQIIEGELYRIKNEGEFSWAIAQLDEYEGVMVEANQKPLYRRETVEIMLPGGTTETAWIYWYNGDVAGRPLIESGNLLEYINRLRG